MSQSKHTPGPWAVGYSVKSCAVYMKPAGDGWLVRDQVAKFARDEEGEANARLIAAAPDLLAGLKMLDERGFTEATWALCKKAIAKAEAQS